MSRSLPPPGGARRALLQWYRPRAGAYPWRGRRRPDPYHVLVSEVMLQQTQAARVASPYEAFVQRFPTLRALAGTGRGAVIRAWVGLGYNRRAVALSDAARKIVREHGGLVPSDPQALQRLPGIGPYTAAAVASIAFGAPVAAVDTNVRRVIARAATGSDAEGVSNDDNVRALAEAWLDRRSPGEWNQALMDLGREVCRPLPQCEQCPLAPHCRYRRLHVAGRAGPRSARRAGAPFEGSFRQLRGGIVAALRRRSPLTVQTLSRLTGQPHSAVAMAVSALSRDGLVRAGPAALAGGPMGRVALSR